MRGRKISPRRRVFRNVVGDRAGELAGDGEIGDGDLALRRRAIVVEDRGPVDVQIGMQAGDEHAASRRRRRQILVLRLIAEPPANGLDFFEAAEADVEHEPDEADDQHGGDDQVVALAGVARVDDQVAQAGIDGDHFRGDHHQPGDAKRDAQADDDLRQGGGKDDLGQEFGRGRGRSCGRRGGRRRAHSRRR